MNKTYSDYDTQIQCEEVYKDHPQDRPPAIVTVLMWLTMQSLQVEVWKN